MRKMFARSKIMKISFAKNKIHLRITALLAAAAAIGLDRITKRLAAVFLTEDGRPLSVNILKINDKNVLNLTYCENTGAAFSILQGQRLFLIIATGLLLTGAVIFLLSDKVQGKLLIWALALIIGGGAGNLFDRIFLGYVVDFIDFRIINFPVFNVADICAVTGAFLFLFAMLREENISSKKKKHETINIDSG